MIGPCKYILVKAAMAWIQRPILASIWWLESHYYWWLSFNLNLTTIPGLFYILVHAVMAWIQRPILASIWWLEEPLLPVVEFQFKFNNYPRSLLHPCERCHGLDTNIYIRCFVADTCSVFRHRERVTRIYLFICIYQS
jgi:hypothetical protein